MNKRKFTKGPWVATDLFEFGCDEIKTSNGDDVIVAGAGYCLNALRADVSLVLAATDMYEALEALLLAELEEEKGIARCNAFDALRKADGETK